MFRKFREARLKSWLGESLFAELKRVEAVFEQQGYRTFGEWARWIASLPPDERLAGIRRAEAAALQYSDRTRLFDLQVEMKVIEMEIARLTEEGNSRAVAVAEGLLAKATAEAVVLQNRLAVLKAAEVDGAIDAMVKQIRDLPPMPT